MIRSSPGDPEKDGAAPRTARLSASAAGKVIRNRRGRSVHQSPKKCPAGPTLSERRPDAGSLTRPARATVSRGHAGDCGRVGAALQCLSYPADGRFPRAEPFLMALEHKALTLFHRFGAPVKFAV